MTFLSNKRAVGLDVGQTTAKAVHLAARGQAVEFLRAELFDAHEEGILDEVELQGSVIEWIRHLGWAKERLSIGLPQYLTTTQIADFPPDIVGDLLEEMVVFETHQLAGLSEEAFVSDHHVMQPKFGRQNSVMIGICRQSVVEEGAAVYQRANLNLVELSMNGMAVANAFFHLHPGALEEDVPQLLLEIGRESSTLLVVAGGQVLFVGSLMFGSAKYTEALAEHLKCSKEEADHAKRTASIHPTDPDCPLRRTTRLLENELRTAIDHWRAGERPEIANKMFKSVWLTGGGAKLRGLTDHFARTYGCDAEIFGPTPPDAKEPDPRFSIAFGLALQGLKRSTISLSLCPSLLKWQRERKERFPHLVAAAVFFCVIAIFLPLRYYRTLTAENERLHKELQELHECDHMIPKLENTLEATKHREKMMLPFVEKGNRSRHLIRCMEALSKAKTDADWFVYLADELSFEEGKTAKKKEKVVEVEPRRGARGRNNPLVLSTPTLAPVPPPNARANANIVAVENMEHLTSLIVAGYTPLQRVKKYEPVRAIARKLNAGEYFSNVDLLPEPERVGREEDILYPWERYFQRLRDPNQFGEDTSLFAAWERKTGLRKRFDEQFAKEWGRLVGRLPKSSVKHMRTRIRNRVRVAIYGKQMKALEGLRFTQFIFLMPLASLDVNKPTPNSEKTAGDRQNVSSR